MAAPLPHITQPMARRRSPGRSTIRGGSTRGRRRLAGARLQGRRGGAPGEPARAGPHAPVPGARGGGRRARGAEPAPGRWDRGVRSPAPVAFRAAPGPAGGGGSYAAHVDCVRLHSTSR